MGGVYAFPGGAVDNEDIDAAERRGFVPEETELVQGRAAESGRNFRHLRPHQAERGEVFRLVGQSHSLAVAAMGTTSVVASAAELTSLERSLEARDLPGGPARGQVMAALERADAEIEEASKALADRSAA